MGISIEERKAYILEAVEKFHKHLLSPRPPGSVLSHLQRLGVAKCAQEAVFCSKCDELPDGVCLKPGTDFYALMKDANLSSTSSDGTELFPPSSNTSDDKKEFLVQTVHAIVRHQHRLDKNWYNSTLHSIASLFLAGNISMTSEATLVRCHQILCEILCLTATSHSIKAIYLAMGEDSPKLPSQKEVECISSSTVEDFDFMSFLKTIRRDDAVSNRSPYYLKQDINVESPEYEAMSEPDKSWLFNAVKMAYHPRINVYFAPVDAKVMTDFVDAVHIDEQERKKFEKFERKCNGVTRFQVETVAAAFSGQVNCAF